MALLSPTIGMSGKWGTVNGLAALSAWQINDIISDNRKAINTRTAGGTDRFEGNIDWTGQYEQDVSVPSIGLDGMPGKVILFSGYVGPSNGVPGPASAGPIVSAYAMVESIQIDWNWQSNDQVICRSMLGGYGQAGIAGAPDGVLRVSNGNPYVDVSSGAYDFNPSNTWAQIAFDVASPQYANVCLSRATLNITSQNSKFVNSCTYGLTGRRMGNVDWSVALTMAQADVSINVPTPTPASLAPGTIVLIRLPSLSGTYWELTYGMVRNQSNFVVSRKTGEVISYTVNIDMCAVSGYASALGHVLLPGGAQYWPAV